jgi:hypothetical protein
MKSHQSPKSDTTFGEQIRMYVLSVSASVFYPDPHRFGLDETGSALERRIQIRLKASKIKSLKKKN